MSRMWIGLLAILLLVGSIAFSQAPLPDAEPPATEAPVLATPPATPSSIESEAPVHSTPQSDGAAFQPRIPSSPSPDIAPVLKTLPSESEATPPQSVPAETGPWLPSRPTRMSVNESKPATSERVLKIFNLENMDAQSAMQTIEQLFDNSRIAMAIDLRSNSLLVHGDNESISKMEAILKSLDHAESKRPPTIARQASLNERFGFFLGFPVDSSNVGEIARLKSDFGQLENNAQAAAGRLRRLTNDGLAPDHPEIKRLRRELVGTVERAFIARQELQKAELAQMLPRLQAVADRIKRRERLKSEIVKQRVQQLLDNPDSNSDLTGPVRIEQTEGLDTIVIRGHQDDVNRVTDMIQRIDNAEKSSPFSTSDIFSAPAPPKEPGTTLSTSDVSSAPTPAMRKPNPFQQSDDRLVDSELSPLRSVSVARRIMLAKSTAQDELDQAVANELRAKEEIQELQSAKESSSDADPSYKHLESRVAQARSELSKAKRKQSQARRQIEILDAEFHAALTLLENELKAAQLTYEAAQEQLARSQALFEAGVESEESLIAKRLARDKGRVRVIQTKTLLDLFVRTAKDENGQSSE